MRARRARPDQWSRREFLAAGMAGLVSAHCARSPFAATAIQPLATRFPDLKRHFVFEYYPWYGVDPVRHWNEADRRPPVDLASNYMPALGTYDSQSTAVIERHAQWITAAGVGAINVSWWGRDSFEDRAVPRIMDVMRDFDIKVSLHLEPYSETRARSYADDVLWILGEYGEKRHFDAFWLPSDANGNQGPVIKGFAMLRAAESTDCHGVRLPDPSYVSDDVWRGQTDRIRDALRSGFDQVTLLCDSLDLDRVVRCGFDGVAAFSNYFRPEQYAELASTATARNLVFSVNTNPGFDSVVPRIIAPDSCYTPPPFEPPAVLDWTRAEDRARAALLDTERIQASFDESIRVQTDPSASNAGRGFFLMYLNSFNEWHEGTSFEPMKDASELTPEEWDSGYHNPEHGNYRLTALGERVRAVLAAR